jgi:hypothetical protein
LKAFALIPTLRLPCNFALTVIAGLRSCFLFLSTRILILLANGRIEALFQLCFSCRETLQTKALGDLRIERRNSEGRSMKTQEPNRGTVVSFGAGEEARQFVRESWRGGECRQGHEGPFRVNIV